MESKDSDFFDFSYENKDSITKQSKTEIDTQYINIDEEKLGFNKPIRKIIKGKIIND